MSMLSGKMIWKWNLGIGALNQWRIWWASWNLVPVFKFYCWLQDYEDRTPKLQTQSTLDRTRDYDNGTPPPVQPMPEEFLRPPRSAARDLMASVSNFQ